MRQRKDAGFTIIELMIATLVFSVIMLVISGALVQVGRLYYKGVNSARTQEVARSTMNDIAQSIQFNNGSIRDTDEGNRLPADIEPANQTYPSRSVCITGRHYSFALGQQVNAGKHALVANDDGTMCAGQPAQDLDGEAIIGNELLGEKMRLSKFSISQISTGTYKVVVGVIYGDKDLLCSEAKAAGSCSDNTQLSDAQIVAASAENGDLKCKSVRSGSQYCAFSELSTIVERRIQE